MHKLAVGAMLLGAVAHAETKPTVSVGAAQVVVGAFDTAAATKVVKGAQAKLLACFMDAKQPGGVATAKIKLAVDGKVSSVTVTGLASSETAPVHNCIAGAISVLKFAAPKDGAVVDLSVPLTFTGADDNIYGGLLGNEVGEMNGGFGFGRTGFGPGGGGTGWGTIGTGRYGTIGHGSASSNVPSISIGQPTASGDLDKAIIRRYIKRNIQKLHYCYEKELLVTPKLAGTVQAQFTISTTGTVSASTASGIKNANVETCIAQVIKDIAFPKPKTGEVVVSYPFTFRLPPPAPAKKK